MNVTQILFLIIIALIVYIVTKLVRKYRTKRIWILLSGVLSCIVVLYCFGLFLENNSPEQMFLNFIPQNESGGPQNMKYLIENAAQDGGYYDTNALPGTFVVSNAKDGNYNVSWKLNGYDFEFKMTKDGKHIQPENAYASMLLTEVT